MKYYDVINELNNNDNNSVYGYLKREAYSDYLYRCTKKTLEEQYPGLIEEYKEKVVAAKENLTFNVIPSLQNQLAQIMQIKHPSKEEVEEKYSDLPKQFSKDEVYKCSGDITSYITDICNQLATQGVINEETFNQLKGTLNTNYNFNFNLMYSNIISTPSPYYNGELNGNAIHFSVESIMGLACLRFYLDKIKENCPSFNELMINDGTSTLKNTVGKIRNLDYLVFPDGGFRDLKSSVDAALNLVNNEIDKLNVNIRQSQYLVNTLEYATMMPEDYIMSDIENCAYLKVPTKRLANSRYDINEQKWYTFDEECQKRLSDEEYQHLTSETSSLKEEETIDELTKDVVIDAVKNSKTIKNITLEGTLLKKI